MFRPMLRLLPFVLFGFAPLSRADIDVRVGGVGCTFSTIQQAIDNANPANGITNILIARNQTYTAQAININGKNVRLIGGYADCNQTVRDNVQTVISGTGGPARSVINVSGSTAVVAFYNLQIIGGDESQVVNQFDSDIYGGAIDVTGGPHQLIYVESTEFSDNDAGFGGAISLRGDSSNNNAVFLQLSYNTWIRNNFSLAAGGGLYCEDATVHFKSGGGTISNNTAGNTSVGGIGGGIYANDCNIRVASSGILGFGGGSGIEAIEGNVATDNGGGIYAFGSNTRIDIYNVDPNNPTVIKNNVAGRFGGGLNIEQGAKVYAWDSVIQGNRAKQGGGAVALYDDGQNDRSLFYMIQDIDSPELSSIASPPNGDPNNLDRAFQCTEPWNCAVLQDNIARNDSNVAQPGSVFRISVDGSGSAFAGVLGGRMTRNTGQTAVRVQRSLASTSSPTFQANGAVIDGNTNTSVLLDAESDALLQVLGSTIANNTIPSAQIVNADLRCRGSDNIGTDFFVFQHSVVLQPGKRITSSTPENGCLRYVIGSVFENIPIADESTFSSADPQFTDASNGNFTLKVNSPALDFAPTVSGFRFTRDGSARSVDLAANTNEFGPVDLGAYEMASSDFPQTDIRVIDNGSSTGNVSPGGVRTYSLLIFNEGSVDSPSTQITSTHSANLNGCAWTCSVFGSGTCPAASGNGPINHIANMPAGAILLYSSVCNVANNATGTVSSSFSAISNSAAESNPADNTIAFTSNVVPSADLELTMFDGVSGVTPGGSVTYAITVKNNGTADAGNVVVTDTFPSGLTCTWTCTGDFSGTCTASGSGNISDTANLPAGAPGSRGEVTYVAVCQISAAVTGSIFNSATVTSNATVIDPNPNNNTATDTNQLLAMDLSLTISNGANVVQPGGTTNYYIVASNLTDVTANNATVIATFPSSLSCTWTCTGGTNGPKGPVGSCPASGSGSINTMINLPGLQTYVEFFATCQVNANATGTVSVSGSIAPPPGITDNNPLDNQAFDSDAAADTSDIEVLVLTAIVNIAPGSLGTYEVSYANLGPNPSGATAQSIAPTQCQSVSWTCLGQNGGVCGTSVGSGNLSGSNILPVLGSVIYTVQCQLNPSVISGDVALEASASNRLLPDANPYNDTDTVYWRIISDVVFRNGFENP